jgi:hypothetical protein
VVGLVLLWPLVIVITGWTVIFDLVSGARRGVSQYAMSQMKRDLIFFILAITPLFYFMLLIVVNYLIL